MQISGGKRIDQNHVDPWPCWHQRQRSRRPKGLTCNNRTSLYHRMVLQRWHSAFDAGYIYRKITKAFKSTKPLQQVLHNKWKTILYLKRILQWYENVHPFTYWHTIITHSHILKGESQPRCPYCKSFQLHLLHECQHLTDMRKNTFGNRTPSDLLKIVEDKNIKTIIKFLKWTKLSKLTKPWF